MCEMRTIGIDIDGSKLTLPKEFPLPLSLLPEPLPFCEDGSAFASHEDHLEEVLTPALLPEPAPSRPELPLPDPSPAELPLPAELPFCRIPSALRLR